MGDGHPHGAAVGQVILLLDEPLAEGLPTDDQRAVVVLQRPGDDLAGRGRIAVDEDDHRPLLEVATRMRFEGTVGVACAPALRDNLGLIAEKLVAHPDGHLHIAAGIVAQVEHQAFHPFGLEPL